LLAARFPGFARLDLPTALLLALAVNPSSRQPLSRPSVPYRYLDRLDVSHGARQCRSDGCCSVAQASGCSVTGRSSIGFEMGACWTGIS
jgi:hypothetical protein